jgi:putative ABC transport system permease protein
MRIVSSLRSFAAILFHRPRLDAEMDEELRSHIQSRADDLERSGLSRTEAERRARIEFGGYQKYTEESREALGAHILETLFQDLRFALRMLRKSPGFTLVAVLTLALGIGANTAIFSVVNAVLLAPLPYPGSDRLAMVWERVRLPFYQSERNDPAPGNFADWKKENTAFDDMAAIEDKSFNLTGTGESMRVEGEAVSASLFSLLRVNAALGRVFTSDEDISGGPRVAVMGYGLWLSRFGADPQILQKSILLDGVSYKVIGVMPRSFRFPDPANFHLSAPEDQLWIPVAFSPTELANHGSHYLQGALARLRPGITFAQAQAQMDAIAQHLTRQYPQSNTGVGVNVVPLGEQLTGNVRPALLILLGAVGFILLMVCANVGNLLLARASARSREMAVRVALGASRVRILRQLLTESVLLALLGGGLGLLLSFWGVSALQKLSPPGLPRLAEISVNAPVLIYCLAISVAAGIVFGMAPSLQASRRDVQGSLKEGSRESASASRLRTRNFLVIAETALGVIVLVGAGLLLRSFILLERTPLGFQPDGVLSFRVIPRGEKYAQLSQRALFYQQALEKIGSLPGVKSAAAVSFIPLTLARASKGFTIEGRPAPGAGQVPMADYDVVSPGYFTTLQIPLLEGRDVSWSDSAQSQPVIVINQAMARTYWPGEDSMGKRIKEGAPDSTDPWLTVVGVVGDIREYDVSAQPRPEFYFSISQFGSGSGLLRDWVVRAADPSSLVPVIREAVWSFDKDLPITRVQTLDEVRSASLAPRGFNLLLLGLFACLALVLACVGLYGVAAYSVAQRTHEIGVRMALGAQRSDVLRLIVGQGIRLALAGIAVGIVAALGLTRVMASLLYGVSATDPLTFAGVAVLLAVVTLAACYVPARCAMRVDPMVALRYE